MTEADERNEVWLSRKRTGPQTKEEKEVHLKSKDYTIDQLLSKAKEAMK